MGQAGIVSYGVYVPRFRIPVSKIAKVWNEDGQSIAMGLGIEAKAVNGLDEDTITISVEAARNCIKRAPICPSEIGAVYVGSESHPYAVKPSAVTVAEAIGAVPECTCADLEFACKAGTAGMQMVLGMCSSGQVDYGLAIGADCAQGRPGDPLEYTAGAGAAAMLIGNKAKIAEVEATYSFSTDTPDFFRREGESYPTHGTRFTGGPAYFRHVMGATNGLMKRLNLESDDFDYCVFHSPNGKFPQAAAKRLGFPLSKVESSLVVKEIGNTYSASSMIGLAAVLDIADPGERILMCSYGSGAGSDAFSLVATENLPETRELAPMVTDFFDSVITIGYAQYAKQRGKLTT
ncbi:MAG: hydroxymethylglutaryl-CoA synthase [Candidatus Heimdallarchaeota archaeon]